MMTLRPLAHSWTSVMIPPREEPYIQSSKLMMTAEQFGLGRSATPNPSPKHDTTTNEILTCLNATHIHPKPAKLLSVTKGAKSAHESRIGERDGRGQEDRRIKHCGREPSSTEGNEGRREGAAWRWR